MNETKKNSLDQAHETKLTLEKAGATLAWWVAVSKDLELAKQVVALVMNKVINVISRVVKGIDRERSGQKVIDAVIASGRKLWYKDQQAVDAMPRGEGETTEFCYLKLGKYCSSRAEVVARLAEFGYELFCDPRAVAEDIIQNPEFADDEPVVCFYGNKDWIAFSRYGDERAVDCDRHEYDWDEFWRVAVRKCQK